MKKWQILTPSITAMVLLALGVLQLDSHDVLGWDVYGRLVSEERWPVPNANDGVTSCRYLTLKGTRIAFYPGACPKWSSAPYPGYLFRSDYGWLVNEVWPSQAPSGVKCRYQTPKGIRVNYNFGDCPKWATAFASDSTQKF